MELLSNMHKIFSQMEARLHSWPVPMSVSAIRWKCCVRPAWEDGTYHKASCGFFLYNHGEHMRKWDGKSTLVLQMRLQEWQRKSITKKITKEKCCSSFLTPHPSQLLNLNYEMWLMSMEVWSAWATRTHMPQKSKVAVLLPPSLCLQLNSLSCSRTEISIMLTMPKVASNNHTTHESSVHKE